VLIVRVHPKILHSEGLPEAPHDEKVVWHDRYRSITNLERHLHENGTRIIKFFLHLSKEEQRKRFLTRIDEKDKNWKNDSSSGVVSPSNKIAIAPNGIQYRGFLKKRVV